MCNFLKLFEPIPIPIGEWHVMSAQQVDDIFRTAGVTCFRARDDYFWFVDENTWIDWLKEAHASAPAYTSITATQRGFDCDKFARHLCDHVAIKYMANGCFEVWGEANLGGDFGGHAWNVIITPNGAFEVEPQGCDIWPLGTNKDYRIQTVYHAD